MIANKSITVKAPLLYNGASTVHFKEINEWVYSLLNAIPNKINTSGSKKQITKTIKKKKVSKVICKNNEENNGDTDEENNKENGEDSDKLGITTILDINDKEIDGAVTEADKLARSMRRERRINASKNNSSKTKNK